MGGRVLRPHDEDLLRQALVRLLGRAGFPTSLADDLLPYCRPVPLAPGEALTQAQARSSEVFVLARGGIFAVATDPFGREHTVLPISRAGQVVPPFDIGHWLDHFAATDTLLGAIPVRDFLDILDDRRTPYRLNLLALVCRAYWYHEYFIATCLVCKSEETRNRYWRDLACLDEARLAQALGITKRQRRRLPAPASVAVPFAERPKVVPGGSVIEIPEKVTRLQRELEASLFDAWPKTGLDERNLQHFRQELSRLCTTARFTTYKANDIIAGPECHAVGFLLRGHATLAAAIYCVTRAPTAEWREVSERIIAHGSFVWAGWIGANTRPFVARSFLGQSTVAWFEHDAVAAFLGEISSRAFNNFVAGYSARLNHMLAESARLLFSKSLMPPERRLLFVLMHFADKTGTAGPGGGRFVKFKAKFLGSFSGRRGELGSHITALAKGGYIEEFDNPRRLLVKPLPTTVTQAEG